MTKLAALPMIRWRIGHDFTSEARTQLRFDAETLLTLVADLATEHDSKETSGKHHIYDRCPRCRALRKLNVMEGI